ncbi:peptidoglycan DD-metalloendopeptidase family protein [Levilactobacillus brevis]|uniref:peptidoglycan DD-metalloendopeptidase family protein n=1 Tax=Levilactobacillus brevis TaxID=1580 RepID=UPI002073CCBD|nr:peptidoglycan DD-metalloendopeptidase family protein [Levilactobacillus brevis]MCM6799428.1 peptidoglycan DD-metalloendopeptidase family protein [Levilactobacillus brevis]MCM6801873.1 peptidoglycan DD-metalloendopeptidase family protein [Levilactobacillus brevis]MCM6806567.1 peptidoglycan DD-metalloendopeptidase family protein [Levilactobacillus brevis]MCM6807470.1 peptidoglycan DD-metalloendopeptidase family protein [Levilactobacillus brevis]MCM6813354.1 peptidoglycan DD-metalloendopeptida
MAETKELRHAGIGIDLKVNGLEEFRKANSMLDDFMRSFHEITGQADKLKESLGSGLNISRDVNQSKDSMAGFRSEFRKTAQQADTFKHNLDFSNVGAKDTESMRKLNDQVGKLRSDKITHIKTEMQRSNKSTNDGSEAIKKYSNHVDEAHHRMRRLHDIIFGSFVGTAISNGLQNMTSGIQNVVKSGYELAEGGEQIRNQWKDIGLSKAQAKGMTDQIGEIRSKSNMAGSAIDAMQKKFYAVTNSVPQAKKFTNEIAAFGAAANKSSQQIQQISMGVAKLAGSKKVSAGFFQRSIGQLPAFQKAIISASGMTTKAFNDQLKNGKLTGAKLQQYMTTAAKMSSKEWANFSKTTKGQLAGIEGTWQNLKAKFAGPLVEGMAKALESVDSKKGGLGDVKKQLQGIAGALGAKMGNYIGEAIKFLVKNRKALSEIASSVFTIGKNLAIGAWKPIASIIKTIGGQSGKASKGLRGFGDALNAISKHKSAIQSVGKVLMGMFAAKKLLGMGTGILGLRKHILEFTSSTRLMGSAIKLLPWALWIAGIAAAIAILVKLYQHDKKFRKFVNGIMASARKMAKSFKNLWGDAKGIFKNGFRTIEHVVNVGIDVLTGDWKGFKKDGVKLIKSFWSLAKGIFKADFDYINDLTGGKLGKMTKAFSNTWKDIGKGWKSFWNGISDWFGDLWKGIVKHVQDGINNVIKVLNSGISGIDSVIHAFGGSSKAIGKINPVHLATGTGALSGQRRAITKPTMAMLNDGHDSPETGNREMLIHPNGMGELIKGTNVMRMLEPGAEVLNATEAKMAMSMQHFASGTGFFSNLWKGTKKVAADAVGGVESGISGIGNFASKAWHGATHLLSTIQKIIAGPGKYLNSLMGKKPSGQGTILSDFAGGFYNSMKKQASTWWSSLWSMASGVLDSSGTGGSWRHDPGLTKTNGFGASRSFGSHDGVDFSGPLGSPILAVHGGKVTHTGRPLHGWPYSQLGDVITVASDDGYQEIYQEFGGMNNIKTSTGDIIKTGQKIATLGRLNGAGSGSHVHIGVSHGSLWDHGGSNTSGWYDVTKMHGKDNGSSKLSHSHTGGAMYKLIQQETGGMMGWIKKHLSPLMDDGGGSMGNPGGAGVQRWRSYVKKALNALNLSASGSMVDRILRQINTESSGNPKAMGGTDGLSDGHAEGLMQVKPGTFAANKLSGHGNIWNGYDNILAGLNYAKHRYGSGLSFLGNGHGYAKGGKIPKGQLSVVGEKGWELFQPNTSGTVIPHEASERLINGSGKGKVSISAPTKVVIQGNADKSAIDELDSRLEKRNDDLVEKLRELWGLNDEGGLTV